MQATLAANTAAIAQLDAFYLLVVGVFVFFMQVSRLRHALTPKRAPLILSLAVHCTEHLHPTHIVIYAWRMAPLNPLGRARIALCAQTNPTPCSARLLRVCCTSALPRACHPQLIPLLILTAHASSCARTSRSARRPSDSLLCCAGALPELPPPSAYPERISAAHPSLAHDRRASRSSRPDRSARKTPRTSC